jgi:hypothetical protein
MKIVDIVKNLEDIMEIVIGIIIFILFAIRTGYSYYEYSNKKIGKKLFSFGFSSSYMRFLGIFTIIGFSIIELINRMRGITFINTQNIPFLIILILSSLFYIYYGHRKIEVCENGIKTSLGCWKWTEIESYEWKYTYITNSIKITNLWIKIPKNSFLYITNNVKLKIYKKEYLLYKETIEKLLNENRQTCA